MITKRYVGFVLLFTHSIAFAEPTTLSCRVALENEFWAAKPNGQIFPGSEISEAEQLDLILKVDSSNESLVAIESSYHWFSERDLNRIEWNFGEYLISGWRSDIDGDKISSWEIKISRLNLEIEVDFESRQSDSLGTTARDVSGSGTCSKIDYVDRKL